MNEWFHETITDVKGSSRLYKFICFMLGKRKKKMTYQEMYAFLYELNRKKLGKEAAKKKALNRILVIYKGLHNNNLPKELENDDEQ